MELTQCINFLLSKAQHSVLQVFKHRLAPYNVTPAQYGVLNCLWVIDGQSPGEIADRLSLDGSTMTGILTRLEQKDLLNRQPDPNDRRGIKVFLTHSGKGMEAVLCPVIDEANREVLALFSPQEAVLLKAFLEQISTLC
ncbi:MAG: MarR family transcriptional regulator [Clostridia bacterium]|jgi:DNA-binding MarR family transcriptional regulator|nr:MarR family transcriptional regulator [Clostridia bacterium]